MLRKLLLFFAGVLLLFLIFEIVTFPRVRRLATENPSSTAFMKRRQAELRAAGRDDELRQIWVPYDRISPHLRSAVIVSEDSRFYEHEGVDTVELERVLKEAWKEKDLGRGGSTITQQLAKNLYLSPSRNPYRKVKEILIARRMEQVLDKRRILEIYLNVVELGERVYGAEAAARHYFDRSAAGLSAPQAALLAGSLPNPRKMNPGDPGPYLRSRRDIILSRMRRWGYMAEESLAREPEPVAPIEKHVPEPPELPDTEQGVDPEVEPPVESQEVPEELFPVDTIQSEEPPDPDTAEPEPQENRSPEPR